jgi:hypothetical protein
VGIGEVRLRDAETARRRDSAAKMSRTAQCENPRSSYRFCCCFRSCWPCFWSRVTGSARPSGTTTADASGVCRGRGRVKGVRTSLAVLLHALMRDPWWRAFRCEVVGLGIVQASVSQSLPHRGLFYKIQALRFARSCPSTLHTIGCKIAISLCALGGFHTRQRAVVPYRSNKAQ